MNIFLPLQKETEINKQLSNEFLRKFENESKQNRQLPSMFGSWCLFCATSNDSIWLLSHIDVSTSHVLCSQRFYCCVHDSLIVLLAPARSLSNFTLMDHIWNVIISADIKLMASVVIHSSIISIILVLPLCVSACVRVSVSGNEYPTWITKEWKSERENGSFDVFKQSPMACWWGAYLVTCDGCCMFPCSRLQSRFISIEVKGRFATCFCHGIEISKQWGTRVVINCDGWQICISNRWMEFNKLHYITLAFSFFNQLQ